MQRDEWPSDVAIGGGKGSNIPGWERVEAAPGFEPGDKGCAVLCLTAWLCRRSGYFRRMPRACQALRGCRFHVRKVRPEFIFIHKVVLWFSTIPRFCRPGGLLASHDLHDR